MSAQGLGEEVPIDALDNHVLFSEWEDRFRPAFEQRMADAQPGAITSFQIISTQQKTGYKLYTVSALHASGYNMGGQTDGGVLAVPDVVDPSKPIAVAIHGHEESPWGTYPTFLFNGEWALDLVNAGFITWAPVSMIHKPFSDFTYAKGGIGNGKGDVYGYIPIWARMISDGMDKLDTLGLNLQFDGFASLGVSGGAQVAFTLMAYRPDVRVGVFAGAQQPLDFYRREYAMMQHERCWDFPGLTSFTQIKALIAPRPIEFQLGRQDPWWPDQTPFPAQNPWFGGTSRDVLVDEIAGQLLLLKQIWATAGGGVVKQYLHEGAHEMVPSEAIAFINANTQPVN
ncbi:MULTISPECIES: hypothetical protein [unclassified Sinorhizobium]|uniref:hypothetical protein n=1 Tax=unclassified Sinorhizobium TaxID=2613772 RepID=UPI003523E446